MTDEQIKLTCNQEYRFVAVELNSDYYDFFIRIHEEDYTRLKDFLEGKTESLLFEECIYDVDEHYDSLKLSKDCTTTTEFVFTFQTSSKYQEQIEVVVRQGVELLTSVLNCIKPIEQS